MDNINKASINTKELSGLALAYLGDSVWELRLREQFVVKNYKIKELNRLVKKYVNAVAQSKIYLDIIDDMEERYKQEAKRIRNSKISTYPKSCTMQEYKNATAFEGLIGMFYLDGREDIIKSILVKHVF